jgi:hypothetical protein
MRSRVLRAAPECPARPGGRLRDGRPEWSVQANTSGGTWPAGTNFDVAEALAASAVEGIVDVDDERPPLEAARGRVANSRSYPWFTAFRAMAGT